MPVVCQRMLVGLLALWCAVAVAAPLVPVQARAAEPGTIVSAPPLVEGEVTVLGGTLTAVADGWQPVAVELTYQWLRNGIPITGATSSTYTVGWVPLGDTFSVEVTGSLPGYTTVTETSEVLTAGWASISGSVPLIDGDPRVGEELRADPGTWSPGDVALTYQWFATDETGTRAIPGATHATLVLTPDEVEDSITVQVTATAPCYSSLTLESAATEPVARGALRAPEPVITGTARAGETLAVDLAGWEQENVQVSYQWFATDPDQETPTPLGGRTSSTLTLPSNQVARRISVRVTAESAGYETVSAFSAETEAVRPWAEATGVRIVGEPRVGVPLSVDLGTWTPEAATEFTYTWLIDGVRQHGLPTYVPVAADLDKTIDLELIGWIDFPERYGYVNLSVGPVQPGDLQSETPTVSGPVRVGETLTADPGSWGPASDSLVLEYRWSVDDQPVTDWDPSGRTFVPAQEQWGHQLEVSVRGSADGYLSTTRTSARYRVAAAPIVAVSPRISGVARTGELLRVDPGTWGPSEVALTQQWLAGGRPIPGAGGTTFRVTNAQAGKRINVRVRGRLEAQEVSALSAPTGAVIGLLSQGRPKVKGRGVVGRLLTVRPGTWGPAPVSLRYQWLRNGKKIRGATATSYRVLRKDRGKRIQVRIVATRPWFQKVVAQPRPIRIKR